MNGLRSNLCVVAGAILALMVTGVPARADLIEEETGKTFSEEMAVEGAKLKVVGAGCREKAWFNVYAAALYIDPAAAKTALAKWKGKDADTLAGDAAFYGDLVAADVTKALVLTIARDVAAEKMRDALREGLAVNMKVGQAEEKFIGQLRADLKDGDVITFEWLPGGKSRMVIGGKPGLVFEGKTLAESLQKIWLGESAVSEHIKTGAVARLPDVLK